MTITIEDTDKTYDSVEEMFADMEREFKEGHPIEYWIDKKLFKGKGLFSYAPHYVLEHPWILLEDGWREIKWAWQRVFRGWDDRVVWSIDYYLDGMIPAWVRRLKEVKHGVPSCLFSEEDFSNPDGIPDDAMIEAETRFNNILDLIAEGFEAHRKMDDLVWNDPERKELEKKFNDAFTLFKEFYESLWD